MTQPEKTHTVVLYDDDEHSFEYVSACLIKSCDHGIMQALQCAYIVDGVGKYAIKHGTFDDMLELKFSLEDLGLKVEIKENESTMC
jgi:ATP-dependent Clp protease adaptor protein ClpS